MDRGDCSLMMEVFMLANGKIIKCMAMENFTTKMDKLPIKETGKTTNFRGLGECSMIGLKKLLALLIIMILLI